MTARTVKRIKRLSTKDNKEKLRKILSAKGNDPEADYRVHLWNDEMTNAPDTALCEYLVETKSQRIR